MVGFHGNRTYQMTEKVIYYIMVYGCYAALNFFMLKFAEKTEGERVNGCFEP